MTQLHDVARQPALAGEQLAQDLFDHSVWRAVPPTVTLPGAQAEALFCFARAAQLQQDRALSLRIASLKLHFLTHAEARLAHGGYGPLGFDVGSVLAHLLINYCSLPGLLPPREAADGREQRLSDVHAVWDGFAHRFQALSADTQAERFACPGFMALFLQKVWADAIGYCGIALVRHSAAAEEVRDFREIADDAMRADCISNSRTLGCTLILAAEHIADADALIARIRQAG